MQSHTYYDEALYFIGLIPHAELREEIRLLKEEMKENYHAKHALKSPAHITLQMPFKRRGKDEQAIISSLNDFAQKCRPFIVDLSGFGCFRPRVIFIKVTDPDPIIHLHRELLTVLREELHFEPGDVMSVVLPHITIATRDIEASMFRQAWPLYDERQFNSSFEVSSIFLLKHNGRSWDIFREFKFGNQDAARKSH